MSFWKVLYAGMISGVTIFPPFLSLRPMPAGGVVPFNRSVFIDLVAVRGQAPAVGQPCEIGYRFPRAAALHKAGAAVLFIIAVGINAIDNRDEILSFHMVFLHKNIGRGRRPPSPHCQTLMNRLVKPH